MLQILETSLDRYLEALAAHLQADRVVQTAVVMRVSAAIALVFGTGLVVAIIGLGPNVTMVSSAAFLIGAAVWLLLKAERRIGSSFGTGVQFTEEARSLLAALMLNIFGWSMYWGAIAVRTSQRRLVPARVRRLERFNWIEAIPIGDWGYRKRSARDVLTPDAFQALEAGAREFNRVIGCLASASGKVAPTVAAESIRHAAEQAMASLFHQAYVMDAYPESAEIASRRAAEDAEELRQLADRLEAIQATDPAFPEADGRTSPMRALLEELRIEQIVRTELAAKPEEGQAHLA